MQQPTKPRQTPLEEASDPSTDPERLCKLVVEHKDWAVRRAVWRNPSVPEDVWREALLEGSEPEAWANPMAPIYVLTWTPREDDERTLEAAARLATDVLWKNPSRCSPEGKVLLVAKVQEWWATCKSARNMMTYLGWWANAKGKDLPEHREVVRLLLLCVRTAPNLIAEDRQALDLLEAWSQGGQDRREETEALASSYAVKNNLAFAQDSSINPRHAIFEVLEVVASDKEGKERQEARVDHERLLVDLIRREMPLPPVVA